MHGLVREKQIAQTSDKTLKKILLNTDVTNNLILAKARFKLQGVQNEQQKTKFFQWTISQSG